MAEKPLHVRVAEALGWTRVKYAGADFWDADPPAGWGKTQGMDFDPHMVNVPRYDTDWSATGPLIEKYRLELITASGSWLAKSYVPDGYAGSNWHHTPLEAVCYLILALHQAGKLSA